MSFAEAGNDLFIMCIVYVTLRGDIYCRMPDARLLAPERAAAGGGGGPASTAAVQSQTPHRNSQPHQLTKYPPTQLRLIKILAPHSIPGGVS